MAFAGYLAWKRVGVRIDWGLQAMEFDTFSGRWCSGDGFTTQKPDRIKVQALLCGGNRGLVGALDLSVRLLSLVFFFLFVCFLPPVYLQIESHNSLSACHSKTRSFDLLA